MKSRRKKQGKQAPKVRRRPARKVEPETYPSNDYRSWQTGDVILVKSHNFIGWLIGNAFRVKSSLYWHSGGRPSNHNGIIGVEGGYPYVYESLAEGFVKTPISTYVESVLDYNECEFRVARIRGGLTKKKQADAKVWLDEHLGTQYDFISYLSHIWRVGLRQLPLYEFNGKSQFYCTEAVQYLYRFLGVQKPFVDIELIAPIHIEQAVSDGTFSTIAHIYK